MLEERPQMHGSRFCKHQMSQCERQTQQASVVLFSFLMMMRMMMAKFISELFELFNLIEETLTV
jgi:hypothetical protein